MVRAELESIHREHLDEMAFALLTSELSSFHMLSEGMFYSRQRRYDGRQQKGLMCQFAGLILHFHQSKSTPPTHTRTDKPTYVYRRTHCTAHSCIDVCLQRIYAYMIIVDYVCI